MRRSIVLAIVEAKPILRIPRNSAVAGCIGKVPPIIESSTFILTKVVQNDTAIVGITRSTDGQSDKRSTRITDRDTSETERKILNRSPISDIVEAIASILRIAERDRKA